MVCRLASPCGRGLSVTAMYGAAVGQIPCPQKFKLITYRNLLLLLFLLNFYFFVFLCFDTRAKYWTIHLLLHLMLSVTRKLIWRFLAYSLDVLSNLMQSDGANEELTHRKYLAMGARKVCQQAIPHAGLYVKYCVDSHFTSTSITTGTGIKYELIIFWASL